MAQKVEAKGKFLTKVSKWNIQKNLLANTIDIQI